MRELLDSTGRGLSPCTMPGDEFDVTASRSFLYDAFTVAPQAEH
jgi:hypothetical protein